jgi:hypothetical protein
LAKLNEALDSDGWLSPDTYCKNFAVAENITAVYMFLAVDMDDMTRFHIAYVGMSTALKNRWATHQTLREIKRTGWHVKRLFKPTPAAELRAVERGYIQKYNPPWNISGKARGVTLN